MNKAAALVLVALLSGCSALDAIKLAAPSLSGGGPSVSAQVGKEANKQVVVGDQSKTEVETEIEVGEHSEVEVTTDSRKVETNIDGDIKADKVSFTNIPPHFIYALTAFAILGWVLPTPMQMWRSRRGRHK
jgi:hypothetical protein